jgi:drug/metabolite transporter (DMT)-like permease
MVSKSNLKFYIALIFAVAVWASSIIITKLTIQGIGPIALCFLRSMVAFIFLLPFAYRNGFKLKMLFSKNAMIYGVFGYGGNLLLLTLGLQYCSANISAIIHGLFPVFMIITGYFMLSEKITKIKTFGILFSVIGVFIATIGDFSNNSGSLIGIVLVVLSVLTWSFYSVYAKKTASNMNSFVLTEICLGASVLCLFPLFLAEISLIGISLPSVETVLSISYLGVLSGGVSVILWNFGIRKVSSAVSGIYFNLMPVFGLVFAALIGETINYIQILGCAFVFLGVIIGSSSELSKRQSDIVSMS